MSTHDRLNAAARALAKLDGWDVGQGVDFATSGNPQVRRYWQAAVVAHEALVGPVPEGA